MVYEIVWTIKAVESFAKNIEYLNENWTEREIKNFVAVVEEKVSLLSHQPNIGNPRNKKHLNTRQIVLHNVSR